jgi:hypothetical protein
LAVGVVVPRVAAGDTPHPSVSLFPTLADVR